MRRKTMHVDVMIRLDDPSDLEAVRELIERLAARGREDARPLYRPLLAPVESSAEEPAPAPSPSPVVEAPAPATAALAAAAEDGNGARRGRGRPPGAKNKPKLTAVESAHAPAPTPTPTPAPAAPPPPAPWEEPAEGPEPELIVTIEELRRAFRTAAGRGRREELTAILAKRRLDSLNRLPEDQYRAVYAEVQALGA
jgi:hypothetical protein